jgi:hypothetical protein
MYFMNNSSTFDPKTLCLPILSGQNEVIWSISMARRKGGGKKNREKIARYIYIYIFVFSV